MPDREIRRRVVGAIVVAFVATAALVSGCASRMPGYPAPATSSAGSASIASDATRGGELKSLTARGIVDALGREGFAVPKPLDTTAQECPTAGCDQSIVTDTLRVKSFASTAAAQTYAEENGLPQVQTIVVRFAPPVPRAEQDRYWARIQALVR